MNQRPKLLDLFCGAGGAAMGYYRTGFDVVGVDIKPMPRYPFEFHQADALEYCAAHGAEFDAIHASPPCEHYTIMQHIRNNSEAHPDLIGDVRLLLESINKPYVIENVYKAPLKASLMLCGTMFGMQIIRHRYFESNSFPLILMPPCDHRNVYDPWHGKSGERSAKLFKESMGIDWVSDCGGGNRKGTVSQAIPPAYTEFIGRYLLEHLT